MKIRRKVKGKQNLNERKNLCLSIVICVSNFLFKTMQQFPLVNNKYLKVDEIVIHLHVMSTIP